MNISYSSPVTFNQYIGKQSPNEDDGCSICLDPVMAGEGLGHNDVRGSGRQFHPMHYDCFDSYINTNINTKKTCPVCQCPVRLSLKNKIKRLSKDILQGSFISIGVFGIFISLGSFHVVEQWLGSSYLITAAKILTFPFYGPLILAPLEVSRAIAERVTYRPVTNEVLIYSLAGILFGPMALSRENSAMAIVSAGLIGGAIGGAIGGLAESFFSTH